MTRSCPGFVGNCPVAWKSPAEGAEAPAPWGRGTCALGLGVLQMRCVYTLRTLHLVLFNTANVIAMLCPMLTLVGVMEHFVFSSSICSRSLLGQYPGVSICALLRSRLAPLPFPWARGGDLCSRDAEISYSSAEVTGEMSTSLCC